MSPLWIVALICVLSVRVDSSCMMSIPDPNGDACSYKGHHIAPGDTYRDMDACTSCNCGKDNSMQCCGFGHQAGVFAIPDSCFMLKDGCNFKIVSAHNHLEPCDTTLVG